MALYWAKFGDGRPVEVQVDDTGDVYDLIEAIKKELPEKLGNVSLDEIDIVLRSTDTVPLRRGKLVSEIYSDQPDKLVNSEDSPLIVLAPTATPPVVPKAQALDQELIDRIRSSVLCLSMHVEDNYDVIATAIVWDYTPKDVLLLTNYHTWDEPEFRYCFPPPAYKQKKSKTGAREHEEDPVELKLHNENDFKYEFVLTSDLFYCWEEKRDFAVLKLPKSSFTMPRIPVSLDVSLNLKIHAFGYIGHTKEFNITGGEVSGNIVNGFTMNLLSACGFSGAAIVADSYGRAVGYMGGNLDASKKNKSQHQSYGFRFDGVIEATNRQRCPINSPAGK